MQPIALGIAPIGWTKAAMPALGMLQPFEQAIAAMALAGYLRTVLGNKYPMHPVVLCHTLDLRHQQIASAWFSAFLTTCPYVQTVPAFICHRAFHYAMGACVIVVAELRHSVLRMLDCSVLAAKPHLLDVQWQRLATSLERLGDRAHVLGMQIVTHHHMGTGVQTTAEIAKLMAKPDPDMLSLLLALGHLVLSGADPLTILARTQARICHIHFCDVRPALPQLQRLAHFAFLLRVKNGMLLVPGDGKLAFCPIWVPIQCQH